jgi:hypothetical protein
LRTLREHEVAILNSGRERFRETLSDYLFLSWLLNASFGFSHFQYLKLLLVIDPVKRTGSFPLLQQRFEQGERLAFQKKDFDSGQNSSLAQLGLQLW